MTQVVQGVSHVIYSDTVANKFSDKVRKAHEMGIPVVSVDWLLKTKEKNERQPEADYALDMSFLGDATSGAVKVEDDAASQKNDDDTKGTKRKRSPSPAPSVQAAANKKPIIEESPKKSKLESSKAVGEGQVLKDKTLQIPLDVGAPYNFRVWVDNEGTVYDASLNLTNSSGNNNKFYRVQASRHLLSSVFDFSY